MVRTTIVGGMLGYIGYLIQSKYAPINHRKRKMFLSGEFVQFNSVLVNLNWKYYIECRDFSRFLTVQLYKRIYLLPPSTTYAYIKIFEHFREALRLFLSHYY